MWGRPVNQGSQDHGGGQESARESVGGLWRWVLPCAICISLAGVGFCFSQAHRSFLEATAHLRVLEALQSRAQALQIDAATGPAASPDKFQRTRKIRGGLEDNLAMLKRGDASGSVAPLPAVFTVQLTGIEQRWAAVRTHLDRILEADWVLSDRTAALDQVREDATRALDAVRENYDRVRRFIEPAKVVGAGAGIGGEPAEGELPAPAATHFHAARLLAALGDLVMAGEGLVRGPPGEMTALLSHWGAALGRLSSTSSASLAGAPAGGRPDFSSDVGLPGAVSRLVASLDGQFASLSANASAAQRHNEQLLGLTAVGERLHDDAAAVADAVQALRKSYLTWREETFDYAYARAGWVLGGVTVVLLGVLALLLVRDAWARRVEAKRRENSSRERGRRDQDAIVMLLDEISGLAEGDLRAYATVSEDVTGAIADAFNYAIDALRELVARIDATAEKMAGAARGSQVQASQLSGASHRQSRQIEGTARVIEQIAGRIAQVSNRAAQSRDVAQTSVRCSSKGATAARETLDAMDSIRIHIADTANRLHRLEQSSQQIGHMVGLIQDIADQTNVLALNAAIQASLAGDAGRGFGVVADEVQRLAERAGQASKRIEVLVGTVQADTEDAITSMQASTQEVLTGIELAQGADASLEEMETVSQGLSQATANIADSAQELAGRTAAVSRSLETLRQLSSDTQLGAGTTVDAVAQLQQLADALETSVAGFRLPPTHRRASPDPRNAVAGARGDAQDEQQTKHKIRLVSGG